MLFGLFKRDTAASAAGDLYAAAVAAARRPALYADLGVADVVEGRFELVLLHTVLVVRRLGTEGAAERDTGRALAEAYFADMDRTLREMGIGDLGVPKRMKKISAAFYGRLSAYDAALAAGDLEALRQALVRNVYDGAEAPGAAGLAQLVAATAAALAAQPTADLLAGRVAFPEPSPATPAGL